MSNMNVRVERLSDTKYHVWRRQMKALLVERDLWQAIGTEVPVITPGLTEEQSQPVQAAIQAAQLAIQQSDAKAKAIIELHVSPHLLYLVREDATARQA